MEMWNKKKIQAEDQNQQMAVISLHAITNLGLVLP